MSEYRRKLLGHKQIEFFARPFSAADLEELSPFETEEGNRVPLRDVAMFKAILTGQEITDVVQIFRKQTGEKVLLFCTGAPILDDGKVIGGLSVCTNITNLKNAEAEIQARQTIIDTFFQYSPVRLLILDNNLRIVSTDTETAAFYGHSRQSIVGYYLPELAAGHTDPSSFDHLRQLQATGGCENNVESSWQVDGDRKYFRDSRFCIPLKCGSNGIGIVGIDITRLKKAEQLAKESDARYRMIAESSPLLFWTFV